MLTIGLSLSPTWLRLNSWRRPDSRVEQLFSGELFVEAAHLAESAHLDFVFKPDAIALRVDDLADGPGFASIDPFVLMTLIAAHTTRIGLVPTVSSSYAHPFATARLLQSLDQISGGRVGVNVVTSLGGAENFADVKPPADLYQRARDFVTLLTDLQQSFPAHSLLWDRDSGVFANTELIRHTAMPVREWSAGPLTTPAVSSAPWPVLHAGGSPASVSFAGQYADAVFAMNATVADGLALKSRLAAIADPLSRSVKVLPGVGLTLADTREEALQLAAQNSGAGPTHVNHWSIVGTPADAAAEILQRRDSGAIDGIIALPGGSWRSLELFCLEVVPLLVSAGAFAADYSPAQPVAALRHNQEMF